MKPTSRGAIGFLAVVAVAILIVAGFLLQTRNTEGSDQQWSAPGNYIVSYGPVLEPYTSATDNKYYLYSSSGERIARVQGPGSWTPVALPTRGGSYLYFADAIRQVGRNSGEISLPKRTPILNSGSSPDGSFAIAILSGSQSAAFEQSAIMFKDDGSIFEQSIPVVPHSLAVGEEDALIVGLLPEGEESVNQNDLYLFDADGKLNRIEFPDGFDTRSDFKYSHVNYLGDGLFEVLQGQQEGRKTHLTSFEVTIDRAEKRLDVQAVREFSMEVSEDLAITRTLPKGENGVIENPGDVYINRRDFAEPEYVGNVGNVDGLTADNFVRVYTPGGEPKFGVERDGKVEIRNWNDPGAVLVNIDIERFACFGSACGIASITEIQYP